jgi:hypothetical protein
MEKQSNITSTKDISSTRMDTNESEVDEIPKKSKE